MTDQKAGIHLEDKIYNALDHNLAYEQGSCYNRGYMRRYNMQITYQPLWDLLKVRNMKKKDLIECADLTENLIANMGNNKYITMKNLRKICLALDCTPNDVFRFDDNIDESEGK